MTSWRDVPGPDGFDARLLELTFVRDAAEVDGPTGPLEWPASTETPAWFMFLRPAGSGYWLCGGAVEGEPPDHVELPDEKRRGVEKLCALLGLTWEEIEAKPAESAAWQLECIRKLEAAPKLIASIRAATPEVIAEWRAEVHTMEPGEDLRERIAGVDFRAGRN